MSGLGKVNNGDGIFLVIAGGYIWDKKADASHECYATQEFEKQDKTIGIRAGAQYGDLTGKVTKVSFRTHPEYGESINVSFLAGGEKYIISISTNNRYSQDMMKALLVMDLEKNVFLKPYDFVGSDKKRAQGISFKQDGEKLNLKVDVPAEFIKEENWFKEKGKTPKGKTEIKRFFEDLNEWFVSEVEEKVVPNIKSTAGDEDSETEKTETKKEEPKQEKKTETKKEPVTEEVEEKSTETETTRPAVGMSILAMKRVLNPYIAENYPGKTLPTLSPDDLANWYDLAIAEEELPFEEVEETTDDAELSQDELDAQLNNLMEE